MFLAPGLAAFGSVTFLRELVDFLQGRYTRFSDLLGHGNGYFAN